MRVDISEAKGVLKSQLQALEKAIASKKMELAQYEDKNKKLQEDRRNIMTDLDKREHDIEQKEAIAQTELDQARKIKAQADAEKNKATAMHKELMKNLNDNFQDKKKIEEQQKQIVSIEEKSKTYIQEREKNVGEERKKLINTQNQVQTLKAEYDKRMLELRDKVSVIDAELASINKIKQETADERKSIEKEKVEIKAEKLKNQKLLNEANAKLVLVNQKDAGLMKKEVDLDEYAVRVQALEKKVNNKIELHKLKEELNIA